MEARGGEGRKGMDAKEWEKGEWGLGDFQVFCCMKFQFIDPNLLSSKEDKWV